MSEKTTIEITKQTWRELMAEKKDPGDSFNDVIQRLLHPDEDSAEEPAEPEPEPIVEDDPEPAPSERGDVDDLLARVEDEIPGSGPKKQKRLDAMRAVLEHLQTVDYSETHELQELAWSVDSDTYAGDRSLWTNSILPGLRRLREDGTVGGGEGKEGDWWMQQ